MRKSNRIIMSIALAVIAIITPTMYWYVWVPTLLVAAILSI